MSVFEYKEYIEASIASVLDQTLRDFEFIIVDDECGYDLLNIINKFKDKRIKYLKNDKNIGLTNSLIKGIENSEGKYIARLDAGNIALKNRLKTQYDFLEKNSVYHLIGSSFELIDENDQTICKVLANTGIDYIKKNLLKHNYFNHSTIMFRNEGEIIYRNKFRYSQDYDFYLNLMSNNCTIGNIADVLVKERLMFSSITYAKRDIQSFFENLAKQFYFERIKNGSDSYEALNLMEYQDGKTGKHKDINKKQMFCRQKVHYLLYSGRTRKARSQISESLKEGFDIKLLIYYLMSLFPVLVRFNRKRKGFTYE